MTKRDRKIESAAMLALLFAALVCAAGVSQTIGLLRAVLWAGQALCSLGAGAAAYNLLTGWRR